MAEATSNIPLKAIASIKAIGDDTYDEAYSALMKKEMIQTTIKKG